MSTEETQNDGAETATMDDGEEQVLNFHEMGLDDRLLQAIAMLGWKEPTPIQEKTIRYALLEAKDVLARARTGSGKTAAFAIPAIQKLLHIKQNERERAIRVVILAPSKELCYQLYTVFMQLTLCCSRDVKCVDISRQVPLEAQRPLLIDLPDVVICTPSRLLKHLQAGNLTLKESLEFLVVDEADLTLSFGFRDDLRAILRFLPDCYQAVLTSATLSEDVKTLQKLVLHNPVILKLIDSELPPPDQLVHYWAPLEKEDKYVLLYAAFKLEFIRGKTIIFVNTVDKCYSLKIFLEQIGVRSCVLNSELPVNSRCHIVSQFNDGLYNIIIASEEKALLEGHVKQELKTEEGKTKKRLRDKESGVSRGIDFQFVSNVLNFDFPLDVNSYIHRVGRTARGTNKGTALSFVSSEEMAMKEKVETELTKLGYSGGQFQFLPFKHNIKQLEGFRYRTKDATRAVTRITVRETRIREIKKEMFASKRLKPFFESNPQDAKVLRHDKALHTLKLQPHLKHVPEYNVPSSMKKKDKRMKEEVEEDDNEPLPTHSIKEMKGKKANKRWIAKKKSRKMARTRTQKKYDKKSANPLQSMSFGGFKKSS